MSPADGDSLPSEPAAPTDLTGTVVRGVAIAGVGYALTQALTLGFFIALARLATPTEFGQVAAGMLLVGVSVMVTESGMLSALIHRRDRLEEAAATAVVSGFAGGFAFSLLALGISPLIGLIFDSHTVGLVAAAMSGLIFMRTASVVPDALLQRRFSFIRRTTVEPVAVIAFGATAVVLTAGGLGVWGLVLGYYAGAFVDLALTWALAGWRPQLRLASFGIWRELIAYGRHTIVASSLIRFGEEIPILLLGRFLGTAAVGQFRYGLRIASLPLTLIMAGASFVVFPALARIASERERFQAAFLRTLGWMAVPAILGGLILIPLGEPLAILVFGEIWADAGQAVMALALFCSGRALTSLIVEGLKAEGRPDVVVRMNLVELCVGTVAMVALVPFGLIAVCLGFSLGVMVRTVYSFRRAGEIFDLPIASMLERVWPSIVAGIVMVAVLVPIETLLVDAASHGTAIGLLLLAAEAALGLLVYASVLHVLAPDISKELPKLLRMASRRIRPTTPDNELQPRGELEALVSDPTRSSR